MPYCQLFYHCVWATKHRQPWITPLVAPELYGYIRSKAIGLGGTVFSVNGIEDHVHIVTTVPASIAVSSFVGQIKGVSSAKLNQHWNPAEPRFEWQDEYGAFTFDGKRLPNVIAYVENQRQHHRDNTTIAILERMSGDAPTLIRESTSVYFVETQAWRKEMLELSQNGV